MSYSVDPEIYDAWYYTRKGRWIGEIEFSLVMKLLHPEANQSLLDVGCGTGYFTQRFNDVGLHVTGVDSYKAMLQFAKSKNKEIEYLQANAYSLPFENGSFDYCTAITSLCFMKDPQLALAEMWRVSRKGIALGLLNRYSLLHILKQNSHGYKGARWDSPFTISNWWHELTPTPKVTIRTAVWCPIDNNFSHWLEHIAPTHLKYGGFLAIGLMK